MILKCNKPADPWEALVYAIVERAVIDYRLLLKRMVHNPTLDTRCELLKIERFFRSMWFEALTDLDGEALVSRLRYEVGCHADET